ncbi:hypothetical protein HFP72_03645 [Nocardiopsis sp. ARC36]
MNDGPLTVNFLNAIVPDNPMATPPPATEQTTPDTGNTNQADRSTPAPEQHTAPPVMTAPIGQAAPPPATAPQSSATDNNQRSTPSERDNGGRSPQNTGGTPTPDSSTDQSPRDGDTPQVTTESAPPAPETETTGNPVDQHDQNATDEQRTTSTDERAPEQRTSSTESPTLATESGPPQDTEATGHNPSERDGEQPDQRDEDTPRDNGRSRNDERDRSGDGNERSGEQSSDRSADSEESREDAPAGEGQTPGATLSRNTDGVPQDQEAPRSRPEPLPDGQAGPERNGPPSPATVEPPATADSRETAAPPTENSGTPVPGAGDAPPATTPDTTEGTTTPTQNTDAPAAPPAAGPERAADSGSPTPGTTRTDPTAPGIDPGADARAASVLDRLPELTRALADKDIPRARTLGAEFWRLLRPVDGPAPENRSIHEARTLAQALVYTVSDPSNRRVPLSGESVPAERVRDAEALARGIGRHLRDRHDPVRARLWQPGGRLTTDYVGYAMQDPADRGPSPYDAPNTVKTVNTALVDDDRDAPAPQEQSGELSGPAEALGSADQPSAEAAESVATRGESDAGEARDSFPDTPDAPPAPPHRPESVAPLSDRAEPEPEERPEAAPLLDTFRSALNEQPPPVRSGPVTGEESSAPGADRPRSRFRPDRRPSRTRTTRSPCS